MNEHPITPPPELVQQWIKDWTKMVHQWALAKDDKDAEKPLGPSEYTAIQAARWGADQELEACCKLLELSDLNAREFLTAARRPKPPSKKQRGLTALEATNLKEDDPLLYQEILNAIEGLPND